MMIYDAYPDRANYLGRIGENKARVLRFDIRDIFDEFPGSTISFVNQRNGDPDAYPVDPENYVVQDGYLLWTIKNSDLAKRGNGLCEIIATKNDVVVKDVIYTTFVEKALDGNGNPPEPWEGWVAGVSEDAQRAEAAAELLENCSATAESVPYGTPATASYENGVFSFGIPEGLKGDTGDSGVYYGTETPTNPEIEVWIDPSGTASNTSAPLILNFSEVGDEGRFVLSETWQTIYDAFQSGRLVMLKNDENVAYLATIRSIQRFGGGEIDSVSFISFDGVETGTWSFSTDSKSEYPEADVDDFQYLLTRELFQVSVVTRKDGEYTDYTWAEIKEAFQDGKFVVINLQNYNDINYSAYLSAIYCDPGVIYEADAITVNFDRENINTDKKPIILHMTCNNENANLKLNEQIEVTSQSSHIVEAYDDLYLADNWATILNYASEGPVLLKLEDSYGIIQMPLSRVYYNESYSRYEVIFSNGQLSRTYVSDDESGILTYVSYSDSPNTQE